MAGGTKDVVRSVDVSPCDLQGGTWYVSVDLPLNTDLAAVEVGNTLGYTVGNTVGYTLTAVLESAAISVGDDEASYLCCMQAQFFVVEITRLVKGNELRVKLLSDDRLRTQVCVCTHTYTISLSLSLSVIRYREHCG